MKSFDGSQHYFFGLLCIFDAIFEAIILTDDIHRYFLSISYILQYSDLQRGILTTKRALDLSPSKKKKKYSTSGNDRKGRSVLLSELGDDDISQISHSMGRVCPIFPLKLCIL